MGQGSLRGTWIHVFPDGSAEAFDAAGNHIGSLPPGSRRRPNCPIQGKAATGQTYVVTSASTFGTVAPNTFTTARTIGTLPAPGPVQCPPGMAAVTVGIGPNQKIICQQVTATAVAG